MRRQHGLVGEAGPWEPRPGLGAPAVPGLLVLFPPSLLSTPPLGPGPANTAEAGGGREKERGKGRRCDEEWPWPRPHGRAARARADADGSHGQPRLRPARDRLWVAGSCPRPCALSGSGRSGGSLALCLSRGRGAGRALGAELGLGPARVETVWNCSQQGLGSCSPGP